MPARMQRRQGNSHGSPPVSDADVEAGNGHGDGESTPTYSKSNSIFSSPNRRTSETKVMTRSRLRSADEARDVLDYLVEAVYYRRPDRLTALEKDHENLSIFLLVLCWYASAVFAITTSKKLMLVLPMPYTLSTCQFTTATVVSVLLSYFGICGRSTTQGESVRTKRTGSGDISSSSENPSHVDNLTLMSMNSRVGKLGTTGPGHIVTNNGGDNRTRSISNSGIGNSLEAGLGRGGVGKLGKSNKDEDIMLIESLPGFNGILGVFTLPPSHLYTRLLYFTAISYTCGFLFTNFAFSVVTASFAETVKSGEPISSVILGYLILQEKSTPATYFTLIPIIVGVGLSCFHDDSFNPLGFGCAAASNIMFSLRAVLAKKMIRTYPSVTDEMTMFGHISMIGLCMLIPLSLYMEGPTLVEGFFLDLDTTYTSGRFELLFILLCNTLAYTAYNTMSFLVLRRTTMVTHAVLNCFRRVFIIVFTCHYFQVPISNFNLVGIGVAVTGVIAFGWTKQVQRVRKD